MTERISKLAWVLLAAKVHADPTWTPRDLVSVELGNIALSWSSYDADLDDLTFKLIIDGVETLDQSPVVIEDLNTSEYVISLTPSTEYYWRIIAFDGQASTESQVFSFRTTPN